MVDELIECLALFEKNEDFVMAIIIDKRGSAPRTIGTTMLLTKDGRYFGTVGGGSLEYNVILDSIGAIEKKESTTKEYELNMADPVNIGAVCGGKNTIHLHYFSGNDNESLDIIKEIAQKHENEEILLGVDTSPKGKIYLLDEPSETYFTYKLVSKPDIYVFGGGHVSQALVPVLDYLDFKTIVLENREEYLTEELFPLSDRILIDYADFKNLNIKTKDYGVVMTSGHEFDNQVTFNLLDKKLTYIGVIGSKSKSKLLFENLEKRDDFDFAKRVVHCPVGLDIKAETPEEIAISIAGEIIDVYRS